MVPCFISCVRPWQTALVGLKASSNGVNYVAEQHFGVEGFDIDPSMFSNNFSLLATIQKEEIEERGHSMLL